MLSRLRSTYVLVAALALVTPLRAQQITGRVVDQQSGQPMAAVQISISGTGIGALSQQTGRYLLLNVPVGPHTVTAQRIGYRTVTAQVTVAAGATVVQDFTLSEEALGLDEIIVTGTPGGTQRRAIGNSVLSVQAADVTQSVAVSNVQDLLGGRAPGLQFTRLSGDVGAGAGIEIRGVASFNLSSDPLIYVDGVRVNNSSQGGPNIGSGRASSTLNDINPEDIASIEVIKGPAAATLYGTEASAGVVQIITKRGQEGGAQFELNVSMADNFLKNPASRLGTQWSCKASFAPPCTNETGGLFPYNAYDEANLLIAKQAFPWPTPNLYQDGLSQGYNLNIKGGTQAVRYFLSGNWDDSEGIVWWNYDKTARMRGNISVVFNDAFSLDFSTGFVNGNTRYASPAPGDGGLWDDLVWGTGYCSSRLVGPTCPRLDVFQEHLPSDVAKVEATRNYQRFTGSSTLNVTPTKWLTSRAILGVDKEWNTNTVLYPLETNMTPVYTPTIAGQVTYERPNITNLSVDFSTTAKYNPIEAVGTSTSVGMQYYLKRNEEFTNVGRGFASPLSRTVNQTPAATATITYNYVENKSVGFYVQEQLSWRDRLFLTAAVRFDDNSAFGSSFDLEKYPKFAATWTVSDESFWKFDVINSFRLRGAWGKAGRQPDAFAGTNQYGVIRGPSGTTALNPTNPGNPTVGPETSTELELGADIALFQDRVSGEFTWFNKKNRNALLSVPLASTLGLGGNIQRNLGRIDNWGWEASLATRIYETRSIAFGMNFSADHVDNEIKDLGDFAGTTAIKVGLPYPNYMARYWIESAKYDPTGPIENGWKQKVLAMCDSGVRLTDGPGTTAQHGLVRGGAPVNCQSKDAEQILFGPAFYTYKFSVSPTLSLFSNKVQLTALAEGSYGKKSMDGGQDAGSRYNNSYSSRIESDPFWVAGDRYGTRQVGGYYDAGFWKLREIGLRYDLPQFLVESIHGDRASLNVSIRNFFTLWREQSNLNQWAGETEETRLHGAEVADPEYGTTGAGGSNWFIDPPLSTLSASLRVSF